MLSDITLELELIYQFVYKIENRKIKYCRSVKKNLSLGFGVSIFFWRVKPVLFLLLSSLHL